MKYSEYKESSHEDFLKDLSRAASLSNEELKEKNLTGVLSKGEYYEYCSRIIKEIYNKYNIVISSSPDSYVHYLIRKGVVEISIERLDNRPKKKSIWNKLFKH